MEIRYYNSQDCAALAELFYDTVHTINAEAYSDVQLDAWATGQVHLVAWDVSFPDHTNAMAMQDGMISGLGT